MAGYSGGVGVVGIGRVEMKPECSKCNQLARLLIECRDALPAITDVRARLYGVDLSLADRIEEALKPWEVPADTEGAI